MRMSPSTTIVPRRPDRFRFGRIEPSDTLILPRSARTGCAEKGLKVFWSRMRWMHSSFRPAPRFEVVAHPDALHLGVLPHRLEAHLSPDAAHLHPAERRGGIDEFVR